MAILIRYGAQSKAAYTDDPIMQAIRYGYGAKLKIIVEAGIRTEQRHLDGREKAKRTSKSYGCWRAPCRVNIAESYGFERRAKSGSGRLKAHGAK